MVAAAHISRYRECLCFFYTVNDIHTHGCVCVCLSVFAVYEREKSSLSRIIQAARKPIWFGAIVCVVCACVFEL